MTVDKYVASLIRTKVEQSLNKEIFPWRGWHKKDAEQVIIDTVNRFISDKSIKEGSVHCWVPVSHSISFNRRGVKLVYFGGGGETASFRFRSGRYAKVSLKKNKHTMFSDINIQPIKPIEYISLKVIINDNTK